MAILTTLGVAALTGEADRLIGSVAFSIKEKLPTDRFRLRKSVRSSCVLKGYGGQWAKTKVLLTVGTSFSRASPNRIFETDLSNFLAHNAAELAPLLTSIPAASAIASRRRKHKNLLVQTSPATRV